MTKLERIVEFDPAFDKRSSDPKKNYGINGVTLRMTVKGDKGAYSFTLLTNWMLPHVQKELDKKDVYGDHHFCHPLPADLGYHSPVPRYEGQHFVGAVRIHHDKPKKNMGTKENPLMVPPITYDGKPRLCEYVGNKPCYYDGSGLAADKVYNLLLTKGSEAVWKYLEKCYDQEFNKSKPI